ncbi:MAG TPA: tetratricopeptide repeat protein [Vicinamibacteria bacterium]|nr:tetratricopeptide repeat protein [Vicinamibacteria bacterium]
MKPRRLMALVVMVALAPPPRAVLAASPGQEALDRGTRLYKEGRYDEAIAAFKRATEQDAGLLMAWQNLGWAYHKSGRHQEAIATWRTVLKVEPRRVELINEIAAIHLASGRFKEAADDLARSLAIDGSQPAVRTRLADAYEQLGSLREAEGHLREALRQAPSFQTALRLSDFLERHGREDEARAALRGALPRVSGYGHLVSRRLARHEARRGDRAYGGRNYKDAKAAYAEAVRLDPGNAQYRINLGWANRQLGEPDEARAAWKAALDLDPARSALYRHIADVALEQADLKTAATMYGRAWTEAERQPAIPYHLAEIALEEGRRDDALLWLDELFRLEDADAEWSRRVAGLFARFEQIDLGILHLSSRLKASRSPDETRAALSRLHAHKGGAAYQASEIETAERELKEAVRLDPKNTNALRDLGWAYWAADRFDWTKEVWTRYAAAHPDQAEPHNLLTHLYLKVGDFASAVTSARASLRLDPKQPQQRLKLAKALHWSGAFGEARTLAEAVAKESPDDLGAQLFWAELLMQYHDFDRGKDQWKRVLDLGHRDAKAEYYWVKSLYELGQYDQALSEARRLLDAEGPKQPLLQFLADDAVQRGSDGEAIQWYALLTRHFPDRVAAWLELARLRQKRGDLEGAQATLTQARQRHPDRFDLALAAAQLDRAAGRGGDAYAAFLALSRSHAGMRDVFWGRFETALETGRHDEALATLRSGKEPLLKGYERLGQEARVLYGMGRHGDAQRSLERVVDPPRGTVYVPILMYHGLGDHPRSASMPAALFESQLRALKRAGYSALTVAELAAVLDGRQLFPARPILITFDDARIDSFERADPILARYGMKATMFVPTARILDGHPFFADWKRIGGFAATGRWDLQSHGHRAHDLISVDGDQQTGSFLVNRQWLEAAQRSESWEEYAARVDADYRSSIEELKQRRSGLQVVGYAFPFSEAGQENVGNEPGASDLNQELLKRYFRFGFVQDDSGYNELRPGLPSGLMLRRFGVPRDMDGDALLGHLALHHPKLVARAQSGRFHYWQGEYAQARASFERLAADEPHMRGEAAYYLAAIQAQRGRPDAAERQLQIAETLGSKKLSDDPALAQRIRWENRVRLAPRVEFSDDSDGRETLWQGALLHTGTLGGFEATLGAGRFALSEDGLPSLEGPELSVAARLGPLSNWTIEGRVAQRSPDGLERSIGWGLGVALESDRVELRGRVGIQDVETLRARLRGLQVQSYAGHAAVRLTSSLLGVLDGAIGRYDDTNERLDLSGKLLVRPRSWHGLGLGAGVAWSDTLFRSDLYYSPEALRQLRGLVAYQRRWDPGWLVETEVGLGLAEDERNGRRGTVSLTGRAGQAWGERLRTRLEGRYGSAPGYESWGFGGALEVRF